MSRLITATWKRLWDAAFPPSEDEGLKEAIASKAKLSAPVIWMLGKVQSGKSSIIQALTGSTRAEIGDGFRACTKASAIYDFPGDAPVVRFLDTRGLGEVAYDPSEDLKISEQQSHLLLVVMKALDLEQRLVRDVARAIRARRPTWPVLVAQTSLHEAYEPGQPHLLPYPFDAKGEPVRELPGDLARSLAWQRAQFTGLPGAGPVFFVPLDFTKPEDAFEPRLYGLEALEDALTRVAPAGLAAFLSGLHEAADDERARRAHPHIMGYAMAAAAADIVPIAGVIAVPSVQAKMLHSLAAIYSVEWDRRMMGEFTGALGAGTLLRMLSGFGARELTKLIPAYGQTVGTAAASVMSFATTYALGKAAAYFLWRRRRALPAGDAVLKTYKNSLKEAFAIAKEKHIGEDERKP